MKDEPFDIVAHLKSQIAILDAIHLIQAKNERERILAENDNLPPKRRGIMGWFDKRYDEAIRRQERYDSLPPHEKTIAHIKDGNRAIIFELQVIRWLLVALVLIAISAMFAFGPDNWWYTPPWAL